MRSLAFVLVTPLIACRAPAQQVDNLVPDSQTAPQPDPDASSSLTPPAHGLRLTSPTVDIDPGADVTYCYYFRTANTSDLAIQRWVSRMTEGGHDMVLFLTPNDQQPPGTMSPTRCGIANNTSPLWTYSAQTPEAEAALPATDGAGNPVAQLIKANQAGFLQIHYVNTTTSAIHPHVELDGFAYDDGVHVTFAGPFVTFESKIQIGPGSASNPTMGTVGHSCAVPTDDSGKAVRFFQLTTYTHKQGVHTAITDGAATVFNGTSWAQPGATQWSGPPFYSFTSGMLGYQCEYLNPNSYTIMMGDSATAQELCMSISFFIPAASTTGHYCLDGFAVY